MNESHDGFAVETPPRPEHIAVLEAGLTEHARGQLAEPGFNGVGVFSHDEVGKIVGGITGLVKWNWLYVSLLWVDAAQRGKALGSRLLRQLESTAVARGCDFAHLDTFSFQAKDFYFRHGYEVFAALDDYPPGHQRFYMKKALRP